MSSSASHRTGAGRTGRRWRELRESFLEECRELDAPCWMCGQAISYDAPAGTPDAFEADHFYPVSTHPELGNDRANLRPSHRACNGARGDGDPPLSIGSLSEEW